MQPMSWKIIKFEILLASLVIILVSLVVSLNKKLENKIVEETGIYTEDMFPSIPSSGKKDESLAKLTATPKPTATSKGVQTSGSTNNTSNSNSNSTSSNSSSNSSNSNDTVAATSAPIAVATSQPTAAPTAVPTAEPANILVWVRGWQYTSEGHQYVASGNIKIKKNGQEIASGSTGGDDVYKVSNMPTNSTLSIYFYLFNGCGQVKEITTGANSSLFQVDFGFNSGTTCI